MTKTQAATLNQRVHDQLVQQLCSGQIPMGATLDERDISTRLGVSRTPLREAIAQLEREGLVERIPYRGVIVKQWTPRQVEDLYLVRQALEVLAIQLAIPKLSNEDIDVIRTMLDRAEAARLAGDLDAYGEADAAFHRFIIEKTGNETLIQTLARLALQIKMIRSIANRDPIVVEHTSDERTRILAALEARDIEAASALMAAHIAHVSRAVVRQLG